MKRIMLINGQRPEELRVAIVANGQLENYLVDVADSGLRRGNIYRGVVAGVQPSLNAAFVEFGADRHGFLAGHDVLPDAYHRSHPKGDRHPRIDQILERGKPVVVQVTKDAMGQKGAALTTNVSLAGRYLVFTPLDSMRGLSRKVEDEAIRRAIKEKAKDLTLPEGAGYIIRTNAADQTKTTLNRDLGALLRLWKRITAEARIGRGPKLLYSDQDLIIQVLRDYLDPNIQEVWVDNEALLGRADTFVKTFMPRSKVTLRGYTERLPLFSRFKLEPQIDAIFQRQVPLPCGGSIVIDPTEALTAIDVNSGKARSGGTQEDNILRVNMEAAEEVARQLRLRDIGGLIVVDFIDMRAAKNNKAVEKAVRDALRLDKARTTVTRISENGLLEINRQRLQQALQLRTHRTCPTCGGLGLIASPEHVALGVIRRIEARAVEGTLQSVKVSLHPELADHIQNQHRRELAELEEEFDFTIEVIAASGMHRHEEQIDWSRRERAPRREPIKTAAAASVADLTSGAPLEDEEEPWDDEVPEDHRKPVPRPDTDQVPPWESDDAAGAFAEVEDTPNMAAQDPDLRDSDLGDPEPGEPDPDPDDRSFPGLGFGELDTDDLGFGPMGSDNLGPLDLGDRNLFTDTPFTGPAQPERRPGMEPEQVGASATAPRKRRRRRRKPKNGAEGGAATPGSQDGRASSSAQGGHAASGAQGDRGSSSAQGSGRRDANAQGHLFEPQEAISVAPRTSEPGPGGPEDTGNGDEGSAASKKRRRRRRKPKTAAEGSAAAALPAAREAPRARQPSQGTRDSAAMPAARPGEAGGAGEPAAKASRRRRRRKR